VSMAKELVEIGLWKDERIKPVQIMKERKWGIALYHKEKVMRTHWRRSPNAMTRFRELV